jgi:hypothetical protein
MDVSFTVTEEDVDLKVAQLKYYNEGPLRYVGVDAVDTKRKLLRLYRIRARNKAAREARHRSEDDDD